MKINKYKKLRNGRYKVILDNCELELYEEVILKYSLLIKKEVDETLLLDINKDNSYYEVYYTALNSIKSRFKGVYDTKEFLLKKEFDPDNVDLVIDKLINQGYLNDRSYAKSYINNKMITTNNGPYKIKKELLNHKIDINIIDEELEIFSEEEQIEKIEKLSNRFLKSNRTRGGSILRQKISNDLVNYGYDSKLINRVISKLDFSVDDDLYKREYDKLYRKLSRKYEGSELEYKIKEKLYLKGLKKE